MSVKDIGRVLFDLLGQYTLHFGSVRAVGDAVSGNDRHTECLDLGYQRGILGENDAVFKTVAVGFLEKIPKKSTRAAYI